MHPQHALPVPKRESYIMTNVDGRDIIMVGLNDPILDLQIPQETIQLLYILETLTDRI